jgi:hypothetical protein
MSIQPKRTVAPVRERDFRQAFCEARQCDQEQFVELVFRECLYRHARPVAWSLTLLKPLIFEADLAMIKAIGQASSVAEIRNEVDLHRYYAPPTGLLRRRLKVRVSGKRVVNLAAKVFGESISKRGMAPQEVPPLVPHRVLGSNQGSV